MKSLFNNIIFSNHSLLNTKWEKISAEKYSQKIGAHGESIASAYLKWKLNYKILAKNFRAPNGGEVDIVCRNVDCLHFVEVKTRTSLDYGEASLAVDKKKVRLITRGAFHWLRLLGNPDLSYSFDIAEVYLFAGKKPKINFIENAFNSKY